MKIDVIGDVHGCMDELHSLFQKLGYEYKNNIYLHPAERIPVFAGDLTDRGPESLEVIRLVYRMVIKEKRQSMSPAIIVINYIVFS